MSSRQPQLQKQDKSKFLKYGDYIILHSSDEPKKFMCARSYAEEDIYFLESPMYNSNQLSITAYPNTSEAVFAIHPKHYYETQKVFDKLKQEDQHLQHKGKLATIKRRIQAEKLINQKRIQQMRGEFITIGAQIQLYHVFTKTYVKASREKNIQGDNLLCLKLTKDISSASHFWVRISPFLVFKKEGECISYDDLIYFENCKFNTSFSLKNLPTVQPQLPQEAVPKQDSKIAGKDKDKDDGKQKNNKEQLSLNKKMISNPPVLANIIEHVPLLENLHPFIQYYAGHKKEPVSDINMMKAKVFKIPRENTNDEAFCWGDYVRIKYLMRESKKPGVIYSEQHLSGFCPQLFLTNDEVPSQPINLSYEKNFASAIFQLVPPSESLLGQEIEFSSPSSCNPQDRGTIKLRLRHYLSGRFVIFDAVNKKLALCQETCQSNLLRFKKENSQVQQITSPSLNSNSHGLNNQTTQQGNVLNAPNPIPMPLADNVTVANEYQAYELFAHNFDLVIQNGTREDVPLQPSVSFYIVDPNNKNNKMSVEQEETQFFPDPSEDQFLSADNYYKVYCNMNPLQRKNHQIAVQEGLMDFFFMTPCSEEQISNYMLFTSLLDPLIQMSCSFSENIKNEKIVLKAMNTLQTISLWVCGLQSDQQAKLNFASLSFNPVKERQSLFREACVLDTLIKLIFELYRSKMLSIQYMNDHPEIAQLAVLILKTLQLACLKHFPNSLYTIQWYFMFKNIIMEEQISTELRFDLFINELFQVTELNVSYKDDMIKIASQIDFADLNLIGLNLLAAFCQFNTYRVKEDQEQIIQTLLGDMDNQKRLFRSFKLNENNLPVLVMNEIAGKEIVIDNLFEFLCPAEYNYVNAILNLTIELCKGGPNLVLEYMKDLYPQNVCQIFIKNEELPPLYRAQFLDLLIHSYLTNDFRYCAKVNYPNYIKFRKIQTSVEVSINEVEHILKNRLMEIYMSDQSALQQGNQNNINSNQKQIQINLKDIIFNYFANFITLLIKEMKQISINNQQVQNQQQQAFNNDKNGNILNNNNNANANANGLAQVNFTAMKKEKVYEINKLTISMVQLAKFLLERGFFSILECEQLKDIIHQLMSQAYIYQRISEGKKKLTKQDYINNVFVPQEMADWLVTCIQILIILEDIKQDQLFKDFFGNNEYSRYFEQHNNNNDMLDQQKDEQELLPVNQNSIRQKDNDNDAMNQGMNHMDEQDAELKYLENIQLQKEKREKIAEYMDQNLVHQDILNFYNLIELLTIDSLEVKANVIQLIYQQFQLRKNFMVAVNNVMPIDYKNISLYKQYLDIRTIISFCVVDLNWRKIADTQERVVIIGKLEESLFDLVDLLFWAKNAQERRQSFNANAYGGVIQEEKKQLTFSGKNQNKVAQKEIENQLKQGIFTIIPQMGSYKIEINKLLQNQTIMLNMHLHESLIELLMILAQPDSQKAKEMIKVKNEIMKHCLAGLIYFILKNEENQKHLMENKQYNEMIRLLVSLTNNEINQLTFALLQQLYKDNLTVLLNLEKNQQVLMSDLCKKFNDVFHKNKTYCIFFMEILKNFFMMNGKNIIQNQVLVIQKLEQRCPDLRKNMIELAKFLLNKNNNKMLEIIEQQAKAAAEKEEKNIAMQLVMPSQTLQITSTESQNQQSTLSNQPYIQDQLLVEMPEESLVLLSFFRTFKLIIQDANSYIQQFVRQIFSLSEISFSIKTIKGFFPLKQEMLQYFQEVFINTKDLEINEYCSISNFIKDVLYEEIVQYLNMCKDYNKYNQWLIYSKLPNIFSSRESYSSNEHFIEDQFLVSYDNYLLQGIIPLIISFTNKIPSKTSENDYILAQKMTPILNELIINWEQEYIQGNDPNEGIKQVNGEISKEQVQAIDEKKKDNIISAGESIQDKDIINKKQQFNSSSNTVNNGANSSVTTLNSNIRSMNQYGAANERQVWQQTVQHMKIKLLQAQSCTHAYKNSPHSQEMISHDKKVNNLFNYILQSKPASLFQKQAIQKELQQEQDKLVQLLLEIREEQDDENEGEGAGVGGGGDDNDQMDQYRFKSVLQSLLSVLSSNQIQEDVRLQALKILRKLSNYKQDAAVTDNILKELCQMNFMDFMCQVILLEENQKVQEEFLLGLIDFIDDANRDIQMSFLEYLQRDQQNQFLNQLVKFLKDSFNQFKNYEKSLVKHKQIGSRNDNNIAGNQGSSKHAAFEGSAQTIQSSSGGNQSRSESFISLKLESCLHVMTLLKLSCENHFTEMQNFLRFQTNKNGEKKPQNVNILIVLAELFASYSKILNEGNLLFGIQLLDTLIELVQGPCRENQIALAETKLLENLEDIIFEMCGKNEKMKKGAQANRKKFKCKVFVFLQSMIEGNPDLVTKIQFDVNSVIMQQLISYKKFIQISQRLGDVHQYVRIRMNIRSQSLQSLSNKLFNQQEMQDIEQLDGDEEEFNENQSKQQENNAQNQGGGAISSTSISSQHHQARSRQIQKSNQKNREQNDSYFGNSNDNATNELKNYVMAEETISEMIESHILVNYLSFYDELFSLKYETEIQVLKQDSSKKATIDKTQLFLRQNILSIEILNSEGKLQKIFFRKHPITNYLSSISQQKFLENVGRDSATQKITSLLSEVEDFQREMIYSMKLNSRGLSFNLTYLNYLRNLNLVIVFIINLIIIFSFKIVNDDGESFSSKSQTENSNSTAIYVLGVIQLIIAILVVVFWGIFKMPLDIMRAFSNYQDYKDFLDRQRTAGQIEAMRNQNKITKIIQFNIQLLIKIYFISRELTNNSLMFYFIIYIFFSIAAISYSQLFYSLLLLDIINRSVVLSNVIRSITQNYVQLLMTAILGIVIIYIYMTIGYNLPALRNSFVFVGSNPNLSLCPNTLYCFMQFLDLGLRSGGGIGDVLMTASPNKDQDLFVGRFFFDLTFFIIITIIWLNIIFGIIIDTFAELRDAKTAKDYDSRNRCFICHKNRSVFENNRINFLNHRLQEHNQWNYVYYIVYLNHKNKIDFDGNESYVYQKIQNQDISWFPVGRAMCLEEKGIIKDDDEEDIEAEEDN